MIPTIEDIEKSLGSGVEIYDNIHVIDPLKFNINETGNLIIPQFPQQRNYIRDIITNKAHDFFIETTIFTYKARLIVGFKHDKNNFFLIQDDISILPPTWQDPKYHFSIKELEEYDLVQQHEIIWKRYCKQFSTKMFVALVATSGDIFIEFRDQE